MKPPAYALFDTEIGRCAIAWSDRGVLRLQLPEKTDALTAARVTRGVPNVALAKPPRAIARAIASIARLLRGEPVDLGEIALDMTDLPPFHQRVYEASRAIAPGETLSYGELAARAGSPGASRAVGQAMGKNPFAIVVPCHRVLAAGKKPGGFSAEGGVATKARMLAIEGVSLSPAKEAPTLPLFRGRAGHERLGFDPDVAREHLRARDAKLARLIEAVGPFAMRLDDVASTFGALAESIVYQQLTGKAAATIFGRVRTACGEVAPEKMLATTDDALRGAGLSRAKLAALKDLAQKTLDGTVPELGLLRRMGDEDIVDALTHVRGIGRWTVEMLLIFRLGRPDVLPVADYGVRKGFARAFKKRKLPTPKELAVYGEKWRPYRTMASWYLWRANDLEALDA